MTRLLRTDWLQLGRDRLALGALAVGLLAALLAVISGHAWADRLRSQSTESVVESNEALTKAREAWVEAGTLDPPQAALLPGQLVTPLRLREPVLPDFSAGRSPLEPVATTVRMGTRPDALFTRYQVENPERLARGGLDLAFVAVVLAPLLLIGVGYGLFVADREAGTARLWLAQAGSPIKLLAARSVNRLALVFTPILLAGLALWLLGPDPSGRAGPVAAWLVVALLGLLFWWAVILAVNAFPIASETAALTLVGLWALLVFVLPVAAQAAASLINPPPSRFEQIAAARAAEVRANRSYDDDHPELSSSTLEGRRASVDKGIEVRRSVAEALAPIRREHAARMGAQQAFAGRLAFLSPPALTAEALAGIARTDARFYEGQRAAAAAHLQPLGAALADAALGRRAIDATTFDALPRFQPPHAPSVSPVPVIWLLALAAGLSAWAVSRLRRARPL